MNVDKKLTGLLLGAHDGIEKDLLLHFYSCGYELQYAATRAVAEDCILTSGYDVIFCFEKFADGETTFDSDYRAIYDFRDYGIISQRMQSR